jgi:MFS transporter, DHA2 family, multidrug resistance protein
MTDGNPAFNGSRLRYALLICSVMLGSLIQILDQTVANVALPHMRAGLGATQDNISWVLTSYIIAQAAVIPITGWLSDKIGQRRLFLGSIGGFIIASVLCGLSRNLEQIVLFRILQGMTGAFLTPLAQTVMVDTSTPQNRNRLMSLYGMGVMIGPILGPIIGAWLTDQFNWRWIFFINIPLGLISAIGLWFLLPKKPVINRAFDVTGFALLALGLASFQLMLDRGEHVDWFNSIEIWIESAVALSAFWMFGVHLFTARNPIYPLAMLRDRNLLVSAVMMLVVGLAVTGAMAMLPLLLEGIYHYPVLTTGMMLATRGIGMILSLYLVGLLSSKYDPRHLISIGFAITAVTFWRMTQWGLEINQTELILNGFVQGLGLGMIFPPISIMAFATIDPRYRTDTAGILALMRSMGSSVGISVLMAVLSHGTQASHAALSANVTPYSLGVDPISLIMPGNVSKAAMMALDGEVQRQALMIAFINDFWLVMALLVMAIPVAYLMRSPKTEQKGKDDHLHALME